jgi:hypothetical protein
MSAFVIWERTCLVQRIVVGRNDPAISKPPVSAISKPYRSKWDSYDRDRDTYVTVLCLVEC